MFLIIDAKFIKKKKKRNFFLTPLCFKTNFKIKTIDGVQVNKHASRDPLQIREGPIIWARAKKMQEVLNGLIEDVRTKTVASPILEEQQHFHFMHIQA